MHELGLRGLTRGFWCGLSLAHLTLVKRAGQLFKKLETSNMKSDLKYAINQIFFTQQFYKDQPQKYIHLIKVVAIQVFIHN